MLLIVGWRKRCGWRGGERIWLVGDPARGRIQAGGSGISAASWVGVRCLLGEIRAREGTRALGWTGAVGECSKLIPKARIEPRSSFDGVASMVGMVWYVSD